MQALKPFVKWAGGKGQILDSIRNKYPQNLGKDINRYCEPFIGGGAVLFDILSNYSLNEVLINDINIELINTYMQIQSNVFELIDRLQKIQYEFIKSDLEHRKSYYYDKRNRFNNLKFNGDKKVDVEKAALFIFLNKTCFNGLFRVNKRGFFNVPIGAYKNPVICDEKNLLAINNTFKNVLIKSGDYKNTLSFIDSNTLVYIDPPYRPITVTSGFTAYAVNPFDDSEQINLVNYVNEIHKIGANVIVSNSDPKNSNVNDNFFDILYKEYKIKRVNAKRMINCNGESRGNVSELLITNF